MVGTELKPGLCSVGSGIFLPKRISMTSSRSRFGMKVASTETQLPVLGMKAMVCIKWVPAALSDPLYHAGRNAEKCPCG